MNILMKIGVAISLIGVLLMEIPSLFNIGYIMTGIGLIPTAIGFLFKLFK